MNASNHSYNSPACNQKETYSKTPDNSMFSSRSGVSKEKRRSKTPFEIESNIAYEIATMAIGSPVKPRGSSLSGDGSTAA